MKAMASSMTSFTLSSVLLSQASLRLIASVPYCGLRPIFGAPEAAAANSARAFRKL
jgi:hypothetical protein